MILKSDSSNPVDHSGTTVYIREHVIDSQVPHELPPDDAVEVIDYRLHVIIIITGLYIAARTVT